MANLEQKRRRGAETLKRYQAISGTDVYAAAADAIADILLAVAQHEEEATQVLQSAEMEFRMACEGERFFSEG
ncbi:MAG: hypothetical protein JO091_14185 [Acidobacteriaceae bacterium]|nr:hypothetical protein [Acidobacteriaceae bacterium]